MGRWLDSVMGPPGEGVAEPTDHYKCMYCESPYDEFQRECSECGQLVVRIVEARPGADP